METVFKRGPGRPKKATAAPMSDDGRPMGLRIRMIRKSQTSAASRPVSAGDVVMLPADEALMLIERGAAERADDYNFEAMP